MYTHTEWLLPITERWYEPKPEISLAETLKLNPESLIEYDNAKNEENQRKQKYTNIINNIQNNSIWYKIEKVNHLSLQSDIKARFDQIFEAEITRYKSHFNLLYRQIKYMYTYLLYVIQAYNIHMLLLLYITYNIFILVYMYTIHTLHSYTTIIHIHTLHTPYTSYTLFI